MTFRTINDSVFVGTRIESAMKPIFFTSGITWLERLGGIGGGQDDVVQRASVFAQILFAGLRRLVEDALRIGDRVNRRHGCGEDFAGRFIFEERFDHVRQTRCGAGSR